MTLFLLPRQAYNEALDINYLMDVQNVLDYLFNKFSSDIDNKDNLIDYEKQLFNILGGAVFRIFIQEYPKYKSVSRLKFLQIKEIKQKRENI